MLVFVGVEVGSGVLVFVGVADGGTLVSVGVGEGGTLVSVGVGDGGRASIKYSLLLIA